jgi:hypothetical protein
MDSALREYPGKKNNREDNILTLSLQGKEREEK